MNALGLWPLLSLVAIGVLAGCTTSSTGASYNSPSSSAFSGQSARRLMGEAKSTRDGGNPIAAIPQFHELIARYPGSDQATEAHYLLGLTYYEIEGYRDAIEELNRYLAAAPAGPYAEESRALADRLSKENRKRFPTSEELDAEILLLREKSAADPSSKAVQKDLADRLWLRGRYEEAAQMYLDMAARDEAFKQDPIFTRRIELRPDGSHVLLTPEEIVRREVYRQPIAVTNLTSFRSGRDRRTQVPNYFVVTGQAINRSQNKLSGVEIGITIYGFGAQVYDTKQFRIGEMYPGETRAFSLRFSNFRELNSIDRYDYSVRFRR